MDATVVVVALVAALLGVAAGFAVGRLRDAASRAELDQARAELERQRLQREDLLGRVTGAETERARLEERLQAERQAAADRIALLEQAEEQLSQRFQALAGEALEANSRRFLDLADTRLKEASTRATGELEQRRQAVEHLVTPLKETLAKVEGQLKAIEQTRASAQERLTTQIDMVRQTGEELRNQTAALVTALRKPQTRGQWGEMQLRRVVEVAGMVERCDFDLQTTVTGADGSQRPDMVVHLAGGKNVVVDAKVPLVAFLEAAEAGDETVRAERLTAHARHLRAHVDLLAAKSYWERLSPTPEFVVLFVPGEAFLAQALETDPALLEHAFSRRVVLATPTTLIALLRTVAYAWTQEALADSARTVYELGRELYGRIGTMGQHVQKLGQALGRAVSSYNETVGSLESRVLVTARKLNELKIVDDALPGPGQLDSAPRVVSAEELTGDRLLAHPVLEEAG